MTPTTRNSRSDTNTERPMSALSPPKWRSHSPWLSITLPGWRSRASGTGAPSRGRDPRIRKNPVSTAAAVARMAPAGVTTVNGIVRQRATAATRLSSRDHASAVAELTTSGASSKISTSCPGLWKGKGRQWRYAVTANANAQPPTPSAVDRSEMSANTGCRTSDRHASRTSLTVPPKKRLRTEVLGWRSSAESMLLFGARDLTGSA